MQLRFQTGQEGHPGTTRRLNAGEFRCLGEMVEKRFSFAVPRFLGYSSKPCTNVYNLAMTPLGTFRLSEASLRPLPQGDPEISCRESSEIRSHGKRVLIRALSCTFSILDP